MSTTPLADCWFLTGPTASGKTAVGLELARQLGAEILSLDSMAVYRGLDIGTAKPTICDRRAVPHHLLDLVGPEEEFSLAQYLAAAERAAGEIRGRGRQVLMVGGTPLYLKSLLRGIFEGPAADWTFRRQLAAEAQAHGADWLHRRLAAVDPKAARRLHPNDTRRLIRALEVYEKTGRPMSEWQQQFDVGRTAEQCRVFVLDWPRDVLYARINRRVAGMFAAGLVAEVQNLLAGGAKLGATARQALGYREVLEHLDGRRDLATTIELVQTRTRQFAKRQLTWFRSLSECRWVPLGEPFDPAEVAARIAREAGVGDSVGRVASHPTALLSPNLAALAPCPYNTRFVPSIRQLPTKGPTLIRTHTCGELRAAHVGQLVTLCGWVDSYRDHGGGLFIDLRDRYGKTQVVFAPESGPQVQEAAKGLRSEFVIAVTGKVARRPEGTTNPKLDTGEIELRATRLEVLNKSLTPPFQPGAKDLPGENLRLKYRYLDLRRPEMQRAMVLRHRIIKSMRDYFDAHQFLEIETPMLGRSTPEGARDYLVPSRIHPGCFYALPQSPQLYKQILMVAGYDRYVQVARCFRDEDLRADRQPEFTQLDVEMSFVNADDVIGMIDGLVAQLAREILGLEVKLPLPRMTYDEAMQRFGHDAPDLRFGLELVDVTDLAREAEFRVFREAAEGGLHVRGLNAKDAAASYSRKGIDDLTDFVKQNFGAKGLVWFKAEEGRTLASPTAKNFAPALLARIAERMQAEPGDLLLFVADTFEVTCKALYALRKRFGEELKLYASGAMSFSWVVEFPMFACDAEEGGWAAMHHPFTAPRPQDLAMLATDAGKCRAQAYDLVINGSEAGGGTIRIHDNEVQQQVFSLLGIDPAHARERFGFLLDALQYGAPPHGGIALGIDRFVMLFGGLDNIRDCIAFPKTQKATDLMTEAPGQVDARQLKELRLKLDKEA